jgi:glycosyltransferase involved in cell wall biosynthesis
MGRSDRAPAFGVKVAYYSPLPPDRSGIADYSELLLPALAERIEVEVVRPGLRLPRGRADVDLYHVGNDPRAHGWIVEALRRRPGVVVLHDFVLHHLVAGMTLGRGDADGYLDAMEREAGPVGRMLAHGVIDGLVQPLWERAPERFPLAREILGLTNAVIVHSRYVEGRVGECGFLGSTWRIPHPAWTQPRQAVRPPELGQRPFVVGCFGGVTESKRILQVLAAFERMRRVVPGALLVLAGPVAPGFELKPMLERLGLEQQQDVVQLDYVEESRLWALMAASDVCVNLRCPTMGETSGVAIRALALGRPLVVSDVGWFAELPDDVVAKVPVDEWEVELLATLLKRLAGDERLRTALGAAASEFIRREHDLGRVADLYVAVLEEAAGGPFVRDALLQEVALAAADVGLEASDPEIARVAAAIREVGLTD